MSNHEHEIALRSATEIGYSNDYFSARPQIDSNDRRNVFEAGFNRAWAHLQAQLEAAKKDAERYQWLCDKGYNYHGAMAGSGSMSICRGPYILLEPPSHNKFSNMILGKQAADLVIDAAIAKGKA